MSAHKKSKMSSLGTSSSYKPVMTRERQMLSNMFDMMQESQCCDITLEIQGRRFLCHKAVLSAGSSFFRAMFTIDMKESHQETVSLKDIDAEIFSLILDFFYTGEIVLNKGNVVDILKSALFFDVAALRSGCIHFCVDNLDSDNWYEIHQLKDIVSCDSFSRIPISYAVRHFDKIAVLPSFLDIDVDTLMLLITETGLTVKGEKTVFEAVIKWYEFSPKTQQEDIENVLEAVRFPLMSADYLCNVVEGYAKQLNLPRLHELVNEAKICHILKKTVGDSKRGTKRDPGSYHKYETLAFARTMTKMDHRGRHFYKLQAVQIITALTDMRESGTLCDAKVVAQQREFLGHITVFAALSPFLKEKFAKLISIPMKTTVGGAAKPDQKTIATVTVDVDPDILELMIEYAYYSGIIEVNKDNIKQLAACSSEQQFNITSIQELCCSFISSKLNIKNCLDSIAVYEELGESADRAFRMACKKMETISLQPEFLNIKGDHLLRMLKSKSLRIRKETVLFHVVMKWYRSCPESRNDHLEKLLDHIRFPLMSAEYLCSEVESFSKEMKSSKLCQLLEEAKLCHLLPEKKKELMDTGSLKVKPRYNYVSFQSAIKNDHMQATFSVTLQNVSKLGSETVVESPYTEINNLLWYLRVRSRAISSGHHTLAVHVVFRPKSVNSQKTTCSASISVELLNKKNESRLRHLPRAICDAGEPYGWNSFIGMVGMLEFKNGYTDQDSDTISFKVTINVGSGTPHVVPPPEIKKPILPSLVSKPVVNYRDLEVLDMSWSSSSSSDSDN